MTPLWRRYEAWLEQHMPDAYWDLGSPATADMLADAEELIGLSLPAEFKESYRIHNGQRGQANGIVGNWRLLPVAEAIREWTLWGEMAAMGAFSEWRPRPEMGIRAVWWNPRWVPFTSNGAGNHHCLDLDPDPESGNKPGQVIVVYSDSEMRQIVAPSFAAWLEQVVEGLEAGRYPTEDTEEGSVFVTPGLLSY